MFEFAFNDEVQFLLQDLKKDRTLAGQHKSKRTSSCQVFCCVVCPTLSDKEEVNSVNSKMWWQHTDKYVH